MKYYEMLKDPRWQRKRLEVMKRSDFTCERCGCKDKTLNVHHLYYEKTKKPWEYDTNILRCLCEKCHKESSEEEHELIKWIYQLPHGNEIFNCIFSCVLVAINDNEFEQNFFRIIASAADMGNRYERDAVESWNRTRDEINELKEKIIKLGGKV
jgi:hypothetical protein